MLQEASCTSTLGADLSLALCIRAAQHAQPCYNEKRKSWHEESEVAMKYKNIMVPYDRSESAHHALATALAMANEIEGAKVTVFFAAPMPEFESSQFMIAERMSGSIRSSREELAHMQEEYVKYETSLLMKDLGDIMNLDNVEVAMGQGKPSKAILDYAEEHKIDLIVMGCRGLNAVAGMLGSVSYAVLRNAECPVLIEK